MIKQLCTTLITNIHQDHNKHVHSMKSISVLTVVCEIIHHFYIQLAWILFYQFSIPNSNVFAMPWIQFENYI